MSGGSPSCRQLTVKQVFVDTSIVHAFYMSQPTHVSGHEDRKHALQPGHGQDVYIGDTVFQGDAQESVEEA